MLRLRFRIEVDCSNHGIPVTAVATLASSIEELLNAIANDIGIDPNHGKWMAYHFGDTPLRFTAEFIGTAEPGQISRFQAAFDGSGLFSLATLSRLAALGSAIEEEDAIGLGLFNSDSDEAPHRWLSITRWRAIRVRQQMEKLEPDSRMAGAILQQLIEPAAGHHAFGRRTTSPPGPSLAPPAEIGGWADQLSARVTRVESNLTSVSESVQQVEDKVSGVEQNLRRMLAHVDQFCQAVATRFGLDIGDLMETATPVPAQRSWIQKPRLWIAALGILLAGALFYIMFLQGPAPVTQAPQKAAPAQTQPPPSPAAPAKTEEPSPPAEPATHQAVTVQLEATSPSWMVVFEDGAKTVSRLLDEDEQVSFKADAELRVRLGNAGGVQVTWNGKPIGAGGAPGQVRLLRFTRTRHESLPVRLPVQD